MKYKILPLLFIIVGFLFLISPSVKNYLISDMSQQSYENLKIQNDMTTSLKQAKNIGEINFVSERDVLKAWLTEVNNEGIGLIAIPSVGLKLPIFRETTNTNLLKGAGLLNDEFYGFNKGNVILTGHHMKKEGLLFQPLMKLKEGEKVYIKDQKKVYVYQIEKNFVINEKDTTILSNDYNGLTLITCDVPTPTKNRIIFQGKLIKEGKKEEMKRVFE
ncbi:class A sortase [Massilibacterium senegalense]|uniref:class A sortase n=1 Tax=Massilibacterium senegalense TaxID=1632858 RepID=UPI0007861362|nr:class A sortase [Massilibacterium senegalense]